MRVYYCIKTGLKVSLIWLHQGHQFATMAVQERHERKAARFIRATNKKCEQIVFATRENLLFFVLLPICFLFFAFQARVLVSQFLFAFLLIHHLLVKTLDYSFQTG